MTITYAIGDIHGCLKELLQLVERCSEYHISRYPSHEKKFVFVGDYIDRGPDSKGVVDYLSHLAEVHECVFLRGNHEDMLLHDLRNCLGNGGRATFVSYGWKDCTDYIMDNPVPPSLSLIPEDHLEFYRATQLWHQDELRTYVHAGIYRSKGSVQNQSESTLLWVRNEFLLDDRMDGGYIVHGHTPMENGVNVNVLDNRCNVDTGGVFGGPISAAVFDEESVKPVDVVQSDRVIRKGPL